MDTYRGRHHSNDFYGCEWQVHRRPVLWALPSAACIRLLRVMISCFFIVDDVADSESQWFTFLYAK